MAGQWRTPLACRGELQFAGERDSELPASTINRPPQYCRFRAWFRELPNQGRVSHNSSLCFSIPTNFTKQLPLRFWKKPPRADLA